MKSVVIYKKNDIFTEEDKTPPKHDVTMLLEIGEKL